MIYFGPVLFNLGILLTSLALSMSVPAAIDLVNDYSDWQVFLDAAGMTLFVGVIVILVTRKLRQSKLNLHQAFLLTTLSWLATASVGALPFVFSDLDMTLADSFFESMSGVTTTGATVISDLGRASPGLLMWRALLQWLGGLGIIVIALAVLPTVRVGGMQLFAAEAFELAHKALPRASDLAAGLGIMYFIVTFVCALALFAAGMDMFDAVAHAMSTISTGGYSTKDDSIGYFKVPAIDWIVTFGMIAGSLPFIHYVGIARGDIRSILRDRQVQWFLTLVLISVALIAIWIKHYIDLNSYDAIRLAAFNVVSIITGTGYLTADFSNWGGFAITLILLLMFVGGCSGSTTCGIKIFRFQILYAIAKVRFARLLQPHGVFIPYYNRKPIPQSVLESVIGFVFLYILFFGIVAIGLAAMGLDPITALSGAATTISNVGPGLGPIIGPAENFDKLPEAAKWLLCFAMLLGRLEIFTVLLLFTPKFWSK
ncbi:cation transporter [Candidatus Endolissoclinum faulkneri L5]|uniref:Trk system potassium uptake protein n=1 Tax=Candidatus Endolissoclinum faulkneri L5 TaxID=1401328 RepID=V9TTJ6_9PROT|nr:TrkH family potassium uptake protein [Candidatus Endolissoclinum faulkneri]AHC73926.1 cation transporter [Candidatus Endolissoclinum faulkneri L5]